MGFSGGLAQVSALHDGVAEFDEVCAVLLVLLSDCCGECLPGDRTCVAEDVSCGGFCVSDCFCDLSVEGACLWVVYDYSLIPL